MIKKHDARGARKRRHRRIRVRVAGSAERPRLSVFRSLGHIYAQVIDDRRGTTLVAASSLEPLLRSVETAGTKSDRSRDVGKLVGERAKAQGIEKVVFDRGGYLYHGRVKALAEGAREAGLEF